jgi:HD-GYP domain-containing protein (c-di-GMP phosphodiesterase class II)
LQRDDGGGIWLLSSILPLGFLEASFNGWQLGSLGGHALRVAAYTYVIAEQYGLHERVCERFRIAAAFHDIGKLLLPTDLLNKPAPLTPAERCEVENHTRLGYDLLLASKHPSLREAALVAFCHHERIDGSGYPHKRTDQEIPLSARIVGVADVFDALTSQRPYRAAYSEEEALGFLQKGSGSRFDHSVVDALVQTLKTYPKLGERLRWFTGEKLPEVLPALEKTDSSLDYGDWLEDEPDWLELPL